MSKLLDKIMAATGYAWDDDGLVMLLEDGPVVLRGYGVIEYDVEDGLTYVRDAELLIKAKRIAVLLLDENVQKTLSKLSPVGYQLGDILISKDGCVGVIEHYQFGDDRNMEAVISADHLDEEQTRLFDVPLSV